MACVPTARSQVCRRCHLTFRYSKSMKKPWVLSSCARSERRVDLDCNPCKLQQSSKIVPALPQASAMDSDPCGELPDGAEVRVDWVKQIEVKGKKKLRAHICEPKIGWSSMSLLISSRWCCGLWGLRQMRSIRRTGTIRADAAIAD